MANNTPEVRFEGFSGEWEERKLSEGTVKIGDGLHGTPKYTENGNVFFINGNNLINGKIIITDETKRVTSENQSKDDKLLNENTILMSINGTIGKLAWYNGENVMLGKSVAYITLNKFEKGFIYSYLQTKNIMIRFMNKLTGTTIKNLGLKTIRDTHLLIPIFEEQTKIGSFFKQLDDSIALQQQELDTLKQTKQGFLQKMFPKAGETMPKIRFPGFSGEWEERQIREIGDLSAGGDINKSKLVDNGEFPVIANALTKEGIIGYYNEYKIEAPAITITGRGDVGHAKARSINFTPVVRLLVLKAPGFDEYFLENCINIRNIFVESTGVPQLTVPQLGNYKISFPGIEEQTKIGSFFKQLDDTIALHQQELDALKETKKAFLQKMFV